MPKSSSSRRTWIEINCLLYSLQRPGGRPPHGGRGLKLAGNGEYNAREKVVLLTEDVD